MRYFYYLCTVDTTFKSHAMFSDNASSNGIWIGRLYTYIYVRMDAEGCRRAQGLGSQESNCMATFTQGAEDWLTMECTPLAISHLLSSGFKIHYRKSFVPILLFSAALVFRFYFFAGNSWSGQRTLSSSIKARQDSFWGFVRPFFVVVNCINTEGCSINDNIADFVVKILFNHLC